MAKKVTEILDTNVLVRFLVGDIPAQKTTAVKWFLEAEKDKRDIIVSTIVIAETIFVLESFYKQTKENVAAAMEIFLSQRWLIVQERDVLLASLAFYRNEKHFVDSYLLAWSQHHHAGIMSFDKKLKKEVKK